MKSRSGAAGRQFQRRLVGEGRVGAAAEAAEQFAAGDVQLRPAGQPPVRGGLIEQVQPRRRALGHGHRGRPVRGHHRRRLVAEQFAVQHGDLRPVGVRGGAGTGMAPGDRGLQLVGPGPAVAQRLGQQGLALVDLGLVPARAILIRQQHQVSSRADPCVAARVRQQQQRQQAGHLGLPRHQRGQRPGQPDRLVTQVTPDQGVAGRGFVARGEHQVHDAQDAAEPPGPLRGRGRASEMPACRILRFARTSR